MKLGSIGKRLIEAEQLLDEMLEKPDSIASSIAGYKAEIERIEGADIDLDTAAASIGVLKTKIDVLENRKVAAIAACAKQTQVFKDLRDEKEAAASDELKKIAQLSVDDLNAALAKLIPQFQHLMTTQYLIGNSSIWRDRMEKIASAGFAALAPGLLARDEDKAATLKAQVYDSV